MKQITKVQLESELEKVQSDINNIKYHLIMMESEKKKSESLLQELVNRKNKIRSYL
ncbi:hypothetical protein [Bacillus cereus group sp. BfR-BA-01380]|uniref:hypothetical protein n=1 Tax=Bacillus cereus group sp. BfR-BA-01380 TaxID=2920324 RepID=UPI001F574BD7|nr:hypothetical protein [Bacillus cereus group sp. BfR-BA-01380]